MNVLLWMPDNSAISGGHRIQLDKTSEYLSRIGVNCTTEVGENVELGGLDLVHAFALSREQIRKCRQHGLPVVMSPIYWSLKYVENQKSWKTRVKFGAALLKSSLQGHYRDKCVAMLDRRNHYLALYEMVDMLLPNSDAEAACIRKELGVTTPMYTVPNAVDLEIFGNASAIVPRDIDVLYIGRFEPHKNQLGFAKAMRGSRLRTLMIGPTHPDHQRYPELCRDAGGGDVELQTVDLPQSDVANLYRRAKVHCLPSRFETTGLVSLEAAICGCNVVTTDKGFARDYFGDLAWYCDPASIQSIRSAVELALASSYRQDIRSRILEKYTWLQTAEKTLGAYENVLMRRDDLRASSQW